MLTRSHPKVAGMLEDAKNDVLAFAGFPQRHWRQIWSTNPLESEQGDQTPHRRRCVPGSASPLRLAGAVLIEQHDEWEAGDRRYFSTVSMLELKSMDSPVDALGEVNILPELTAA